MGHSRPREGNDIAIAIAKIIQDDGRCPKNLQIDRGKEFCNANMQKLLKKHDINHYSTYSIGTGCRTIQSYVKKQYVEIVYG